MTLMEIHQFNLLDLFLIGFLVISVLLACSRGLGREVLHSLLFGGLMVASYFYVTAQEPPVDGPDAARMLVNYSYIVVSFYFLTWFVLRGLAPVFLSAKPVSIRERFWAGSLAFSKIVAAALALNLWYAVHSTDAHPLRLQLLPDILRHSVVVNLSDATTDEVYRWMASKGWLEYNKYIDRPQTDRERQIIETQEDYGFR